MDIEKAIGIYLTQTNNPFAPDSKSAFEWGAKVDSFT